METSVNQSSEIKLKTHFSGKVVKTSLAGALVDIGTGTPAYLHVSQIVAEQPDQPIKMVGDILKVGHEVEVWVKKVRDGRVELTMQKPLDLDWKDLKADMVVKGKVVRLEKFGVFVEIGAERPGLIHISELAHGYVKTTADVVKEGDEVEAMILDVNKKEETDQVFTGAVEGLFPEFRATAGATASSYPLTDIAGLGNVPYGTTTQYQNFFETLCLYMEFPYLTGTARLKTAIQTKGRGDHYLELVAAGMNNILAPGNTAPIVYGALDNLKVRVEIEEIVEDFEGEITQDPKWKDRKAFYQIEKPLVLTASMNRFPFEKLGAQGQLLAGMHFICRANEAGSATTATGQLRNDEIPLAMEVRINDTVSIAESSWKQMKTKMRRRWGYYAPLASSVGEDTGISGVILVQHRPEELRAVPDDGNLKLLITTAAQATASDYGTTGNAQLKVIIDSIDDV